MNRRQRAAHLRNWTVLCVVLIAVAGAAGFARISTDRALAQEGRAVEGTR